MEKCQQVKRHGSFRMGQRNERGVALPRGRKLFVCLLFLNFLKKVLSHIADNFILIEKSENILLFHILISIFLIKFILSPTFITLIIFDYLLVSVLRILF